MKHVTMTSFLVLTVLTISCGPSNQAQLEANKDLMRQLGAINDAAAWDRLDTLLSEDFRRHSMATIGSPEISSREEFKRHEKEIRELYPDRHVIYEKVIAEGDFSSSSNFFRDKQKTWKTDQIEIFSDDANGGW